MEMNSLLDFPIGTASAGQVDIMKVAGISWECHILHKDLTTWSVLLCSAPKLSWGSVIEKPGNSWTKPTTYFFSGNSNEESPLDLSLQLGEWEGCMMGQGVGYCAYEVILGKLI